MMLIIAPQQDGVRFGILEKKIIWRSIVPNDRVFFVLQKMKRAVWKGIVVCAHAKVSWSGQRTAVALGNTIAFSRNIPVGMVRVRGDESDIEMQQKILSANMADVVSPVYNGEPNITTPNIATSRV